MANVDLQSFLEDRLVALDPSIDISPGSPAQTKFIDPVLTYLGTDPFETDIDAFLLDRFAQEFPDLYIADPGALRDLFIKPLQLILEPFKREISTVRRNQSLIDPSLLSDADADSLVANVFDSRDRGGFAGGTVRAYFPTPTDVRVEVSNRVFSTTSLNFFPTSPVSLTAEMMSFNRDGSLFYMDIPVRAEQAGASYNIEADEVVGIDGLSNVVRATNLKAFTGGSERQDNETFVSAAEVSLTERSLANRRGTVARLNNVFQGQLRGIQVIGAKDPEMQRDLIVAQGHGHSWITGLVALYGSVAFVRARTIEGGLSSVPAPGDTLYFYLYDPALVDYLTVPLEDRLIRLRVEELYVSQPTSAPYQYSYFVRWSDPEGVLDRVFGTGLAAFVASLPKEFEGGFARKDSIQISSLPGVGTTDITVPSGELHVYGHADIYVRPTIQDVTKVTVDGIYDLGMLGNTESHPHFFLERTTLVSTALSSNVTDSDASLDFVQSGVQINDTLIIESGSDAGFYTIGAVTSSTLSLDHPLTATASGLRYRVVRTIRLDPFNPRIPKFPFGGSIQGDLQTSIGSTLLRTTVNDMLVFGAAVGDVVRILEGPDAGDYIIQSFDAVLGGQGMVVDRATSSTGFNLTFEVFTKLNAVQKPLVRLRELLLLDSAKQSTGLTIPPADPAAVIPAGAMTSASVLGQSQYNSGYVLPDLSGLLVYTPGGGSIGNHAAADGDRRYSMGFDTPDGLYISLQFFEADLQTPTTQSELDLRSDTSGKTSFFLATVEDSDDTVNYPPVKPKSGECLSIKNGPNKGDYLIKEVYSFKYTIGPKTFYLYFIQIYGTFPVDPIKQLVTFIKSQEVTTGLEVDAGSFPLEFPTFFTQFYSALSSRLATALTAAGMTGLTDVPVDEICSCFYECGVPSRGVLRSFFREPTLFEQKTAAADTVTTYSYETSTGDKVKFRPDPIRYQKQEIVPGRLTSDASPTTYPRDLVPSLKLAVTIGVDAFVVGDWVKGAVSQAYGKVLVSENNGGADFLYLTDVMYSFTPTETIVGATSGSATYNGPMTSGPTVQMSSLSPSIYMAGVNSGDYLAAHEETPLITQPGEILVVQTTINSPIVTIPDGAGLYFPTSIAGALLFIEEGDDAGGYKVVKRVDARTLILDRPLSATTLPVIKAGVGVTISSGGAGHGIIIEDAGTFSSADIGRWVTIFGGIHYLWVGSYPITAVDGTGAEATFTLVPATAVIPGYGFSNASWAVTEAPVGATLTQVVRGEAHPSLLPAGSKCYAGVPIRAYESSPTEVPITSVIASTTSSTITITGEIDNGMKLPYRVFRPNVRRISPTEMSQNQSGFLYYFDTEVVSLSPSTAANIGSDVYLTADDGTYTSIGYRHVVEDPTLSYSSEETGFLDLPPMVLPVGVTDSRDSLVRVIGSPVQVSYEKADVVELVQEFVQSVSDRLVSADILVRHFLPAYVSYDATYQGGSDPSVIAQDIISYLDQIPIETSVDVSEIEKLIDSRGGNPDTPTTISATIYDWDRRMWVEFSQNSLGGPNATDTKVPYNGSPRVTYFLPGPNESGQDPIPPGERINLTRR